MGHQAELAAGGRRDSHLPQRVEGESGGSAAKHLVWESPQQLLECISLDVAYALRRVVNAQAENEVTGAAVPKKGWHVHVPILVVVRQCLEHS